MADLDGDGDLDVVTSNGVSSTTREGAVTGALDEMAVHDRVLSTPEVAEHSGTGTAGR